MDVVIVDRDDNVIGSKPREQVLEADFYRVSALWVTNSKSQVLLAQRLLGKRNDPGKWGPAAAGTVESGETYESNIYKEAREEIGVSGFEFKEGPKLINETGHRFFVQWFTVAIDWPIEKFKVQGEEVEKIEWLDKAELIRQLREEPDKFIAGSEQVWSKFLKD